MLLLSLKDTLMVSFWKFYISSFSSYCIHKLVCPSCPPNEMRNNRIKREYTKKTKTKLWHTFNTAVHKTHNDNTQSGCGKLMKELKKKIEIISKKQVTLPYLCELRQKGEKEGGKTKQRLSIWRTLASVQHI